jgi:hypothetical protein
MQLQPKSSAFCVENTCNGQLQIVIIIADNKKKAVESFNTIITETFKKRLNVNISEESLKELSDGLREICKIVCTRQLNSRFTTENKDGFGCYSKFYRYSPSLLILIISNVHNIQSVKTNQEKQKQREKIENLFKI